MKIYKILMFVAVVLFAASCDDGKDFPTVESSKYVTITAASSSVGESVATTEANGTTKTGNNSLLITVRRVDVDFSSAVTVNLSVTSSFLTSTDFADAGEAADSEFTLSKDVDELTIPAGSTSASFLISTVNDDDSKGNKSVAISITGANNGYAVGDALSAKPTSVAITLVDDDCPIPGSDAIIGTKSVVTTDTSPAGCSGVTNTVKISVKSENMDGSITYSLSDVTGGLYVNCYGSAEGVKA